MDIYNSVFFMCVLNIVGDYNKIILASDFQGYGISVQRIYNWSEIVIIHTFSKWKNVDNI